MPSSDRATWRSTCSTVPSTGSASTGASGTSASTSSMRTCATSSVRAGEEDEGGGDAGAASATGARDGAGQGAREGTGQMTEHNQRNELRFTRVFEAPRELVFECMTDPDHLTHFWGPTGVSAPRDRITVDARAGRRVRDGHGQRRRRQRVPDARGLRRGAATRAARVDRSGLGHAGHLANSWRSGPTAPRSASTKSACPRP